MTFEATLTNSPNPPVDQVILRVYRSSDDSLIDTWVFSISGDLYTLAFDTTQLSDGEYDFVFSFKPLRLGGGSSYETLSVLYFSFSDDTGTGNDGDDPPPPEIPIAVTLGGLGILSIAIVMVLRRR